MMNAPFVDKHRNIPVYSPDVFDTVYSNMRYMGSSSIVWSNPYVLTGPPPQTIIKNGQTSGYLFYKPNELVDNTK